ncbi:MAG TPA: VWA domain-containing protein [Pyrinomonadaceae bacterium]|nr:VWA domain-containing protein [Pyrinomonadaceae bacterium]
MKFFLILLLVAICPLANAQETEVVRTNVELVQTAVTVLDKKGNFVDGLQRDQFELMVDGKARPVAFFERITSGSPRERELAATLGNPEAATKPIAPSRVAGRTILFFLDDQHLSADSMNRTRMMLQRFLEREMTSNDNVAITTASGQVGFLEQFTNNRAILDEAMSRLVPRPYDAEGYSAGGTAKMTEYMAFQLNTSKSDTKLLNVYIDECMKGSNLFRAARMTAALLRQACETEVKNSSRAILIQAGQITQNTYHSLSSVMRSLMRVPGRKLAFFISDGFLLDAGPNAPNIRDKFDYVVDAAQRAGVVVYTIHAKGLVNSGYMDPAYKKPVDERIALNSIGELEANQDALNALANDTGGRALRSTNFFDKWVGNVLDETSNYYVVAWRPEKEEEKVAKFRNVKITVVGQPELTVRAPRGYVAGPTPEPTAAKASDKPAPAKAPKTPDSELRDALSDFYPAGGLPTLLSLTYLNTPANGLVVTSSIEVIGKGVSYGDDGKQPATIKLAGVVLNDKGKIASSFRNQLNIDPPKSGGADAVFYNHHTPLAPGIYQFRVAARDERSGRVGSAIQWIVIPDLAKNQLTLSSVLLGGQVLEDKSKEGTPHVQLSVDHSFPRMSQLGYWVFVYNAKRDAAGNPQLTVQTQVLRDGQPVLSSPQRRLNNGGQDALRIPFGEELALKTLPPGKYDLKVTVTDGVAGTSATQIADFIVR